jgi:hypothetical protein
MSINYYKILGVSEDVSLVQLKKAYRDKAKEYHPDTNNGDESKEEYFRLIIEGYEILKERLTKKIPKEENIKKRKTTEKQKTNWSKKILNENYELVINLTRSERKKGGVRKIKIKPNFFLEVKIRPGVTIGEKLHFYLTEDFTSSIIHTHLILEVAGRNAIKKYISDKIGNLFIGFVIIGFICVTVFSLIHNRNIGPTTVKAIILDKQAGKDYNIIVYKNTEGHIFKISNAINFWDCGKVGDSILVDFKQRGYEEPIYINVRPLKNNPLK